MPDTDAEAPLNDRPRPVTELRTMGFRDIPAPLPDPCVAERRALEERVDALDAALDALAADIAARREELRRLASATTRLIAPEDARRTAAPSPRDPGLRAQLESMIAAYNDQVAARNAVAARLKALPPC